MKSKISSGIVLVALFAAMTSASFFFQIPLPGGIPILLQDMMALLCGLILGPVYGACAIIIFLLLGCMGYPVFSGKGGVGILIGGPTGGFLFGYLAAVILGGIFLEILLPRNHEHSTRKETFIILCATILEVTIEFTFGIIGFKIVTNASMAKTLSAVLIPFIPVTVIKIILMVPLTKKFRRIAGNYLWRS